MPLCTVNPTGPSSPSIADVLASVHLLLEDHREHVVRLVAEEALGVGDVVGIAPGGPLARESAKRGRLPGARLTVPEDELASPPW
jgi:hypothetical protein